MSLPSIHSSSLPRFVTATPVSESASILKHRSNLSALFDLNKKIISLSGQICGMQQESRNAKNVEEKMKQACLNASAVELPTLYAQARELSQKK